MVFASGCIREYCIVNITSMCIEVEIKQVKYNEINDALLMKLLILH